MTFFSRGLALALPLSLLAFPVAAQVAMQGSFMANGACPAFVSIKKQSNPGNVSVAAGQSYVLLGKNKDQASHYWIEVPGAAPARRWVAVDCGSVSDQAAAATPDTQTPAVVQAPAAAAKPAGGGKPGFILAMSWQPAFCELHSDKPECVSETPDSFEASHLTLHGLWPQPRGNEFCSLSKEEAKTADAKPWAQWPEPELSAETRAKLDIVMPGTQSLLERHEWMKHGECYPGHVAETYFKDAIRLMDAVNTSPVRDFLAANVGKTIQVSDLGAKFDEAFGAGAGNRLKVACKRVGSRRVIVELTLGLKGDISAGTPLKDLIAASGPTQPDCPSGIVDPVGLQ